MSYESGFSFAYDKLINEQIDFGQYCSFLRSLCLQKCISFNNVLDAAAGSGIFTWYLARAAKQVSAFDLSEDMLNIARQRLKNFNNCRLFCDDLTKYCENEVYDAVFCTLDGLNHIINEDDFCAALKNLCGCVKRGGALIFDLNTIYKHTQVLCNNCYIFDDEDFFLSWQNFTDGTLTDMEIDCFMKHGDEYYRYSEDFSERAYSDETVTAVLNECGFSEIRRYDFEDYEEIRDDSEKIIYFAIKE